MVQAMVQWWAFVNVATNVRVHWWGYSWNFLPAAIWQSLPAWVQPFVFLQQFKETAWVTGWGTIYEVWASKETLLRQKKLVDEFHLCRISTQLSESCWQRMKGVERTRNTDRVCLGSETWQLMTLPLCLLFASFHLLKNKTYTPRTSKPKHRPPSQFLSSLQILIRGKVKVKVCLCNSWRQTGEGRYSSIHS